jgi:alcohol dehydrogenase
VGVPREALPELAELAAVEPAIFNNPRPATSAELLAMLEEVW